MSFINQVDPEIAGALDANQAERYRAIGDDPPLGRDRLTAIDRTGSRLIGPIYLA